MKKASKKTSEEQIQNLQSRISDLENTFLAIQNGEVDALVLKDKKGKSSVFSLKGAEAPYRFMVETMLEGAVTISKDGTIMYCNKIFSEMIKRSQKSIIGSSIYFYISNHDSNFFKKIMKNRKNKSGRHEIILIAKDKSKKEVYLSYIKLVIDNSEYLSIVVSDISDLKQLEKKVYENEMLYRELVESSPFGIFIESNQKIVFANSSLKRMLGISSELNLSGKKIYNLFHSKSRAEIRDYMHYLNDDVIFEKQSEVSWRKIDGQIVDLEIVGKGLIYQGNNAIQVIINDITERKKIENKLQYMATHDPLTGLLNRHAIEDMVEHSFSVLQPANRTAILFLDVDSFKDVNDTLGHPIGDELLKLIAARLSNNVRKGDTVARLGGDEFIIIIPNLRCENDVIPVATKLLKSFNEIFRVGPYRIKLTASIGISISSVHRQKVKTLLKNADIALYQAKKKGRNNFQFFTRKMASATKTRVSIERKLCDAISEKKLDVFYQPQIELKTGNIISAEALVRWIPTANEMIAPSIFIPIAEETGLIHALGDYVLQSAFEEFMNWKKNYTNKIKKISINLSPVQLMQPNLVRNIIKISKKIGFDLSFLTIELTENALVTNLTEAILNLEKLQSLGIALSIDDFGTGYSSFSYLKYFTINEVKIDLSFVKEIGKDMKSESIIQTIIAMAHKLKANVVAEGVDTKVQFDFLKLNGCDMIQGYYISPPISGDDFLKFILSP